jgi:micrococcal nuclease
MRPKVCGGKIVKVWPTDTDQYGRTVAFVFVGDVDLNKELLKAGLAWHYKHYSSAAWPHTGFK